MDGKVLQTIIDIGGNINPSLSKSIETAIDLLGGLDKATVGAMTALGALGLGIGAGVTALSALASELKRDIDLAAEWETKMGTIVKIVNELRGNDGSYTEDYYNLSGALRKISTRIPVELGDLSDSMTLALQDGTLNGITEGLKAAEDAAKISLAYDIGVDEASQALSSYRLNFDLDESGAFEIADLINYLGQNSGNTPESINNMMTELSGISDLAGADEKVLAALAATVSGIDDSSAATAIKNLFVALESGEAATKKQRNAFKALGLSATDVAKTMQTDMVGTLLDVLGAVDELDKNKRLSVFKDLFGKTSMEGLAILADNTDDLERFLKVIKSGEYSGSVDQEVSNVTKTLGGQLQLFRNTVDDLRITAGEKFLPVLTSGLEFLSGFINEHGDELSSMLVQIGQTVINEDTLHVVESALTLASTTLPAINFGVDLLCTHVKTLADTVALITTSSPGFWMVLNEMTGAPGSLLSKIFGSNDEADTSNKKLASLTGETEILAGSAEKAGSKFSSAKTTAESLGAVNLSEGTLFSSLDYINGKLSAIDSNAKSAYSSMRQLESLGNGGGQKFPGILGFANGGFASTPSIFGESGLEAAISFKPSQRQRNIGVWAKAGEMLGVLSREGGSLLAVSSNSTGTTVIKSMTFAPVIQTTSNASPAEIIHRLKDAEPEFTDLLIRSLEAARRGRYDEYSPVY